MLASSETPMDAFIDATQSAERMCDGFADYFSRFDALLTPTLPLPAHRHDLSELMIDGQTVSALQVMGATTPLNVTGLPGLSIRFCTSLEGLPIGVQLVAAWHAESTILHLATALEARSPVRNLQPAIA
ncbi:amidase family protein [Lichenicola cladoniae]|uniref:amidase family protein n=1 Tax=Lichenicola cladoniae TaxID=1484109 RepID=UPI001EF53B34|nr:amidase family protein [Lichenicola cladoniae]